MNQQKKLESVEFEETQKTRNLLDQSLGSEESVELLREFFNQLLVLVQPLYNASR